MSTIDLAGLAVAIGGLQARMSSAEQELNEADARLGDGDTGGMLVRVIDAVSKVDVASQPDLGAAFSQMSRRTAMATGSSLGTLIATALGTLGTRLKGVQAITTPELAGHLDAALEVMMKRGGATLGDKTVLDSLSAVAAALRQAAPGTGAQAARMAAADALASFRGKPCKIGRARLFAEKSADLDDPGMLAAQHLVTALTAPSLVQGQQS